MCWELGALVNQTDPDSQHSRYNMKHREANEGVGLNLDLHIQWWKICFLICLSFNLLFSTRCHSPSVEETSSQPIRNLLFLWVAYNFGDEFCKFSCLLSLLEATCPLAEIANSQSEAWCQPLPSPLTRPWLIHTGLHEGFYTTPRLCLWGWELFCCMVHYMPAPLAEFCYQPGAPCLFSDSTSLSVSLRCASHAITLLQILRNSRGMCCLDSIPKHWTRPGGAICLTNFKCFPMTKMKFHTPKVSRPSCLGVQHL